MTEITFTGNLNDILRMIDDYKSQGYVYKKCTEHPAEYTTFEKGQQKVKKVIIYKVVMAKNDFAFQRSEIQSIMDELGPTLEKKFHETMLNRVFKIDKTSLQQELSDAIDREDYETAAKLRDKIKAFSLNEESNANKEI